MYAVKYMYMWQYQRESFRIEWSQNQLWKIAHILGILLMNSWDT